MKMVVKCQNMLGTNDNMYVLLCASRLFYEVNNSYVNKPYLLHKI